MFIFSSVGNLIYIEPYHYSVTRSFFSIEIRLLQMSVELRQPSQIEDCRHFFSGKWRD